MLVFKPSPKFLLPPPKIFTTTTTTTNSKPNLLHLHHRHDVKLHFPLLKASTLSSSSSSPLSPPQPTSDSSPPAADSSSLTTTTAADFLMDSGGLSYVQAIQVIRKVPTLLLDGGIKPRLVIAYFESIGFSKTHISKLISKYPRVLVADLETTLKPKIQLLQLDFGFPDSDIADLIASKPTILNTSLENQMKPALELVKSFVKTDEDLIKAIKSNNNGLLLRSIHHRNYIEPNVDVLRHHGVPDSEILHFILSQMSSLMSTPKVFKSIVERIVSLGFKPGSRKFSVAVFSMCRMKKATWDSKIDLLKGLGWSDEQILGAFRRSPNFLTLSRENLKESIEFYVESMNWDDAASATSVFSLYPIVLCYSLKRRVIPRYAVLKCLMSKEIIKQDKLFFFMVKLPETQFLSKYVFKYQDQLPYLYELYNKECMLGCEEDNRHIDMTV